MPLEDDVLRPLNKPGEVSLWLYVIAQSEVSGSLFEERIGFLLDFLSTFLSFLPLGLRQLICTIFATVKK